MNPPRPSPPRRRSDPGRSRLRWRPALVAVGALAALVPGPAAPAQEPAPGPGPAATQAPTSEAPGPVPELAPELAEVAVSGKAYDAARARRDRLANELDAARRLIGEKGTEITALEGRDQTLTTEIDRARDQAVYWEAEEVEIAASVRAIAIDSYVSGRVDTLDPLLSLDAQAQHRAATEDVTIGSLAERRTAELERARRNAGRNRQVEQASTAVRDGVRQARGRAQRVRDQATADEARLAVDLLRAEAQVVEESRLARVEGADFPLVVLDAYWKGAQLISVLSPGCGITWWALAGVGKVESRHGTYSGGEVRADGSLTKPVIGIPLTGQGGTASIPDSDGGLIDGDPTVDRAAGPMQFIPQTWARWGRDGNGDGRIEIQNLYDAAASAAAYLCASGPLTDDAGLNRAYFSYNRSLDYVASVLGHAKGYAAAVPVG